MGFLDKAKQMAEQAQKKIDDAQRQFNESRAERGEGSGGVRYDEHGRPIADAPAEAPADAPPAANPAVAQGVSQPQPPDAADPDAQAVAEPRSEEDRPGAPPASSGGANTAPDPFRPID
ncbi:MAG TPA: hypothetical protein VGV10_00630 [Thermoleophilaceae bacterium]|nr:hypothetical protein [Thermoleophilaceae bacterium]